MFNMLYYHILYILVIIMGKSWGGSRVGEFVIKHPQFVSKVVLVAPPNANALVGPILKLKGD